MQSVTKRHIITISSFLLVLLFVYTGCSKLLDHHSLKKQLEEIHYIEPFAGLISVLLPVLEIFTGLAIAYKPANRYGLWSAAVLMSLFSLYVGIMLATHKTRLPCSCGGVIAELGWKKHLYFNIFFMVLAWASLKLTGIRKKGVS
jgi:putative oxidoreductase